MKMLLFRSRCAKREMVPERLKQGAKVTFDTIRVVGTRRQVIRAEVPNSNGRKLRTGLVTTRPGLYQQGCRPSQQAGKSSQAIHHARGIHHACGVSRCATQSIQIHQIRDCARRQGSPIPRARHRFRQNRDGWDHHRHSGCADRQGDWRGQRVGRCTAEVMS
jgi:hypothetical protein